MKLGLRFIVHGQVVGRCDDLRKLDNMVAAIRRTHGTFKHLTIAQDGR